ncbi:MAG: amidohydrolase family protein, partial [Eubacteriales bacterium]|nr:amidohydrolase family protein [Eubacteriales bacterium]
MVIDFHTHTFPDKIAEKTIATLEKTGGVPAHRNGTVSSLLESMERSGVDISVVLPVATSPRQVPTINRVSYELNRKNNLYFSGAIHPDCEDVEGILDEIKAHGLFGIKLHPDYQGVYFNDDRYLRILTEAAKRDLYILTHAGRDVAFPNDIHCTPDHVLDVLRQTGDLLNGKLILAHMGACEQPREVLEKLVGRDIYFDTAFVLDRYIPEVKEIIRLHGADKILFATDTPWGDQKHFVEVFKTLCLD